MAEGKATATKRLQAARKEAGFSSAAKFAESIGMSINTYTHYEQCEDSTPLKAARTIAQALGCTIDKIAGIEKPAEPLPPTPVQDMYEELTDNHKSLVIEMLKSLAAKEASDKAATARRIQMRRSQELQRYRDEFKSVRPDVAEWGEEAFDNALLSYIKDDLQRDMDKQLERLQSAMKLRNKSVHGIPFDDDDQYELEQFEGEGLTLSDVIAFGIEIDEESERLARQRDAKYNALLTQLSMENPALQGKLYVESLKDTKMNTPVSKL